MPSKTIRIFILLSLMVGGGCQLNRQVQAPISGVKPPTPEANDALVALPPMPIDEESPSAEVTPVTFQDEMAAPSENIDSASPAALPSDSFLKLSDLETLAQANNPALAQASANVEAARGNYVQVGLPPNLRAAYSASEIGNESAAGQQGGYLAQEFVTGHKLRLNRQVAAWQVQRAESQLRSVRLRVLTDVRSGYYNVLIAQRRRDLAADLVRISKQAVEAAGALFHSGEVSEADPLRARVEAASAQILLQNSINQHIEAWRRLAAVLGLPDMQLTRLEGQLDAQQIDISWQGTLAEILQESPEMAAAMANIEAARWTIERAYAQIRPNIDIKAGAALDNSTGDTISNVRVEIPLPLWNRNQGGIRQAQAQARAAQRAADRLALDLQARLASVFQRYQSARNQVEKYSGKGGILESAERTLELIRAGYQAEEFGVLDLVTAQRTYFQANLAYLDSLRELWTAAIEIEGLLLSNSLAK